MCYACKTYLKPYLMLVFQKSVIHSDMDNFTEDHIDVAFCERIFLNTLQETDELGVG